MGLGVGNGEEVPEEVLWEKENTQVCTLPYCVRRTTSMKAGGTLAKVLIEDLGGLIAFPFR